MDVRFRKPNIRRPYRSGSLKTIPVELTKYLLHLLTVQDVRWDSGGSESGNDYAFFYGIENTYDNLQVVSFLRKGVRSEDRV